MTRGRSLFGLLVLGLVCTPTGCVAFSASESIPAGDAIVAVALPFSAADHEVASRTAPDRRYPAGSRVVLLRPGADPQPRVLSAGLYAAGGPAVAADGKRIVFAGRSRAGSRWSIYEARTSGGLPRELVRHDTDCIEPGYLGGGRLVFVCRSGEAPGDWALHTADADGSNPRRISFGTGAVSDPSVLQDGRVLFSMRQQPGIGRPRASSALFTVNPDGTLLDAFVGSHEASDLDQARETGDGGVLFLVRPPESSRPYVERVEYGEPGRTRRRLDIGLDEPVTGVEPLADGGLLLAGTAGVWRVGPEPGRRTLVGSIPGSRLIDAVPVEVRPAPRGRPSPVDPSRSTATVVCYDAKRSDPSIVATPDDGEPTRIVVDQYGEGALGELAPEPDGSFFLELPADRPIRVRSLDGSGREIAASDWFWLRPGEVRACFGCHEKREAAPVNRTISALRGEPVRVGGGGGP